jgi:hypothetical protein
MTLRSALSLLIADFAHIGDEVKNVIAAGCDWISFHPDAAGQVHCSIRPCAVASRPAAKASVWRSTAASRSTTSAAAGDFSRKKM